MPRIALTGVAAGKSVAAARFAELGAVVIDYDVLAREAVAPGSGGLAAIAARFGPGVIDADGGLNRPALGALVFADDAARADLEAILHPEVYRLAASRDAAALAAAPAAVVVHDIPLLAETADQAFDRFHFDRVVAVSTPEEVRVQRLIQGRRIPEAVARGQLAAQAPETARLALADTALDGSGAPQHLRAQVDKLWEQL